MLGGTCLATGCELPIKTRGMCSTHYQRAVKNGDITVRAQRQFCSVEGCGGKHTANGYCKKHWSRWARYGDPLVSAPPRKRNVCAVDGCEQFVSGQGLCKLHYQRWYRHGDPLRETRIRPVNGGPCLLDGCAKPAATAGLCNGHYLRLRNHGHPLGGSRMHRDDLTVEELFDELTVWTMDGCLLWIGARCQGYGLFTVNGESMYAHRWAYEQFVGPIPEGLVLDHVCHTLDLTCRGGRCRHRLCVNFQHLEPVTSAENTRRGMRNTRLVQPKAKGA